MLSVAVLIHQAEVTQGRPAVLAVGLDKLCPQASLVSVPFGGPYALCCKEPPAKHLVTSVAAFWRRFGSLSRCLGGSWALSRASWSRPERVLGLLEPLRWHLRRSWGRLGGVLGALGATREASWALLEPFGKRLGRSWSRLGGVLGALGSVSPIC